jgi:two-component system sensor histidine kinase PilS (NtrC family)
MDDAPIVRHRLLWWMALRAVGVTALLVAATLARVRGLKLPLAVDPFFAVAAATYAITVVWALTLRYLPGRRWLVDLHLATDALLVSALVLVTGGVESYFSTLYALPVVAASLVQYRRGGVLVAVLAALLFAGLVASQYTGVLGVVRPARLVVSPGALPAPRVAALIVGLNALGFLAVALLTGYLAENLRRAGEHLEAASTQIADLRALSQHVIDSLTGGLATTDHKGRILTFNRAAERIVGLSAADARGRSVRESLQLPRGLLLPLDGAVPPAAASAGSVTPGRGQRTEYTYTRADGVRLDLGLTAAPLVTSSGQAGWIFTFQDLTDEKRREREAQMQKRLAAVGEMAAGIAHEIRNPLASMTGSIQILRQELALSPEQAKLMDIVLRESERLNDTIRTFLAYARPRRPEVVRFEVRRALRDTTTLLRNSPEFGEGHRVELDVQDDELWFDADESQFRQIVWNLATNAIRAMPEGGRLWLRAALSQETVAPALVLEVRDEGTGIAPDEIERVFHPFRSSFAQGTGLGLAIVHRIVTDHGGTVAVASEPRRGTTIRVTLPAQALAAAPSGPPEGRAADVA